MATDQLVSAADVLRAISELRRRGSRQIMEELERQEVDLAEYFLEELSDLHQRVSKLSVSAKIERRLFNRIENLGLVCILALRQAQLRLWQADTETGPLADLSRSLESDLTSSGGNTGWPTEPSPGTDEDSVNPPK